MNAILKKSVLHKSRRYLKVAGSLEIAFSHVSLDLMQAGLDLTLRQHIAVSIYQSVSKAVMVNVAIVIIGLILGLDVLFIAKILLFFVPLVFVMMFYTSMFRPQVIAKKKARMIEQELPNALRHLLIEIRSGVPIYNAFVAVSDGYGVASEQFKTIVRDINAGKSEVEAIENSIFINPSLSYRRSFWQLLNAMKTGTDIEKPLSNIVDDIIKEQLISIKRYGQELNPLTLMYMMFAVIMPSLGITFMIILSTFTGSSIVSPMVLVIIIFGLIIFQMFFLSFIKTKRPNVRV